MAHIGHRAGQARLHHQPTKEALQSAQTQQCQKARLKACWDHPSQPKPCQRHGVNQPHEAREETVKPLPKIDEFKVRQSHARRPRFKAIFRRRPVFGKFCLPHCFAQRRQDACDGLPLGDRKPALSKASDPANHNNDQHHRRAAPQPNLKRFGIPVTGDVMIGALYGCGGQGGGICGHNHFCLVIPWASRKCKSGNRLCEADDAPNDGPMVPSCLGADPKWDRENPCQMLHHYICVFLQ